MVNKKILNEINKLANHLGLTLKTTSEEFFKSRTKLLFTSKAMFKDGEEVIFRFALTEKFNRSIEREVLLYQTAKDKRLDFLPDLLDSGHILGFKWLIYKYINWQPSGDTYRFAINRISDYDLILRNLGNFSAFNSLLGCQIIKKCNNKTWPDLVNKIIQKDKDLLSDPIINKAIVKVKKKKFFPTKLYYVHGDFHPKNIFISGNRVKIIDWESSHFNSFAFDCSFVWIRSYNEQVRKRIWQYLVHHYSANINEINYVFLVNLLRDHFEWNQAIKKKNELLFVNKIDNKIVRDIMDDLYQKIKFFSNKPI